MDAAGARGFLGDAIGSPGRSSGPRRADRHTSGATGPHAAYRRHSIAALWRALAGSSCTLYWPRDSQGTVGVARHPRLSTRPAPVHLLINMFRPHSEYDGV